MQKIHKFAEIYKAAVSADTHRWASDVVSRAFQQVMGRWPTPAEKQIVMAVSDLESSYGRGWGKGNSTSGDGSHNWGAVQTTDKSAPGFSHQDSSAQGKYNAKFKSYESDIDGAADVVKLLFKGTRHQRMPDPSQGNRALGREISGPTRGELIEQAAQQGDTLAFSRAMWFTGYFEGTAPTYQERILRHAEGLQTRINQIASALGESPAWSIKTNHYQPAGSVQLNPQPQYEEPPVPEGMGESELGPLEQMIWGIPNI